jgi:hypothetical protein
MQILYQSVHATFLSFFVIEVNDIIKIPFSFFSSFSLFHRADTQLREYSDVKFLYFGSSFCFSSSVFKILLEMKFSSEEWN